MASCEKAGQEGAVGDALSPKKKLPDFLQSVNLKYVKLGYHYLITHAAILLLLPLFLTVGIEIMRLQPTDLVLLWEQLYVDLVPLVACAVGLAFGLTVYIMSRPRPVFLVDFACALPPDELKLPKSKFKSQSLGCGLFDQESLDFQFKILDRCGIGEEAYLPPGLRIIPANKGMANACAETQMVMFDALDKLFQKTNTNPKDIGILIVNCSIFCPTPSLSAMIVNRYGMRSNIRTFNLGGMGCSAGVIAIDLAKDMLQAHGGSLAIVVSTENITQNWYFGKERSMLISNCLFRMGCAAILLSNRWVDGWGAKYKLMHTVRTHLGAKDKSYCCVAHGEDEEGHTGISLSKDLMVIAGDSLKANITTLGPLVLPLSEQILFFAVLVGRKLLGMHKLKPYIPDFKLAFDHFCIHSGGRAVLDEVEKNLQLTPWHLEPSRMTLYRFGNTSSSSIWYELAYSEAKGRVRRGDRVWQIAFGSGFKCNSAVWRALRNVDSGRENSWAGPWRDCIKTMPINLEDIP
eukprot:TRINITY_DN5620_c0_g2_i1.p1 TRINITY_DN5620_c0_g2~~TRINITY_DN5620_c0_g2_i1.p1  ORF type:complete len:537 (-),score=124.00 TRINITY_DN5620_c0_g2_i1:76-1629(-)